MDMPEIKINGQDHPDFTPLKPVEPIQNAEPVIKKPQSIERPAEETPKITSQEVKEVIESFQEMSESIQTKLGFSVHESNNEIVIKVFDKESNELIRQFPSEEMLALQDKMSDLSGFLLNENA